MKLELTPRPVPQAPSKERWREMTKAERERFIVSVNEALSDPLIAMSEGMVANLERKYEEAERQAEKNRVTIRDTILAILAARGVTCTTETLEGLHSCIDADILKRWVTRALTATSKSDVFSAKE